MLGRGRDEERGREARRQGVGKGVEWKESTIDTRTPGGLALSVNGMPI